MKVFAADETFTALLKAMFGDEHLANESSVDVYKVTGSLTHDQIPKGRL